MKDLKFIKECENCHHNISYDKCDVHNERTFIGYTIVYNEWGDGDYHTHTKPLNTLEDLVKEISFLTNNKSINGSKFRILNIYAVAKNSETIICPNCNNKIILKEGRNTYHSIDIFGKFSLKYISQYSL